MCLIIVREFGLRWTFLVPHFYTIGVIDARNAGHVPLTGTF
jgi:hypothetical protein